MRGDDPIGRVRLIDVLYTGSVLFCQRVHSSFTAVSRSHEVGFGIETREHCYCEQDEIAIPLTAHRWR